MTIKINNIIIKNIYYMLVYVYDSINKGNIKNIEEEDFDNIYDLFSVILYKEISGQLKRGLYKEYIPVREDLTRLRGKVNIYESVKNQRQGKKLLNCEYDEFSENNLLNKIIKSAGFTILSKRNVSRKNKENLKKVLLFFENVDLIDVKTIKWNTIVYTKNSKTYMMIIYICYFIIEEFILSTSKGNKEIREFYDNELARLFEKFVLNYYKYHHSYLKASSEEIPWDVSESKDNKYLPKMLADIVLENNKKVLIIDTKYHSSTYSKHYYGDKYTLKSHNLYQIYTYVKNKDIDKNKEVSGLLLYALTSNEEDHDYEYNMGNNKIYSKTLNLNRNFEDIKKQLDTIANKLI